MIRKGKELGDWSECPFLLLKVLDKNIYLKKNNPSHAEVRWFIRVYRVKNIDIKLHFIM